MEQKGYNKLCSVIEEGDKLQADYFAEHMKQNIKVTWGGKNIYIWNEAKKIWKKEDEYVLLNEIAEFFVVKIREAVVYLRAQDDDDGASKMKKNIKKVTSAGHCEGVKKYAMTELRCEDFEQLLNLNPDRLEFQNGSLCLRTGKLLERKREDYITSCLDYDYAKSDEKEVKQIEDICFRIANDDPETYEGLMSYFGYCLTGERSAAKFLIMYGPTASNGKSTMCEIYKICLPKYCNVIDRQVFIEGYQKIHKYIPSLGRPVRMIYAEELSSKKELNISFLKNIVTDDAIPYEVMFGLNSEIVPQTKLILPTNHVLSFHQDEGFARRGMVHEAKNQFLPQEDIDALQEKKNVYVRDDQLLNKFKTNTKMKLAYINLLLQYSMKFYSNKNKLYIPSCFRNNFKDLTHENDKMKQFLENGVEVTGNKKDKMNKITFERLYNTHMKAKEPFSRLLGELKRLKIEYVKDHSHQSIKGVIYGIKEKEDTKDECMITIDQDPFGVDAIKLNKVENIVENKVENKVEKKTEIKKTLPNIFPKLKLKYEVVKIPEALEYELKKGKELTKQCEELLQTHDKVFADINMKIQMVNTEYASVGSDTMITEKIELEDDDEFDYEDAEMSLDLDIQAFFK
jgi:phage/plasmid-associated DNA primase